MDPESFATLQPAINIYHKFSGFPVMDFKTTEPLPKMLYVLGGKYSCRENPTAFPHMIVKQLVK
jgi:hypothetical protein